MLGLQKAVARVRIPVRNITFKSSVLYPSVRAISTHKPRQLLQLQNSILPVTLPRFFSQSFLNLDNNTNSTSPSMSTSESSTQIPQPTDPNIHKILDFWFRDHGPKYWFQPPDPEAFDQLITTNFKDLVDTARDTDKLDFWNDTPRGSLALVLLLDQFPRNIYRLPNPDAHLSFASDAKAVKTTTRAIARDFDKQIASLPGCNFAYRSFFYVPLMHAEDLLAQVAGVALYDLLLSQCQEGTEEHKTVQNNSGFAKQHMRCIREVGRFPKRNEALGREMREDEVKWLEEHPKGF